MDIVGEILALKRVLVNPTSIAQAGGAILAGENSLVRTYDVVVYGGTPSGCKAAEWVARLGLNVLLISPNGRIGGIDTAGLARRDYKGQNPDACLSEYTLRRAMREAAYYGTDVATFAYSGTAQMSIEPKIAERCYRDALQELKIPILKGYRVKTVNKPRLAIESIILEKISAPSQTMAIVGAVFIDASYQCDLVMRSGVTYTYGREANATYSETVNGIRGTQLDAGITSEPSPYIIAGNSGSGLLPYVNAAPIPTTGTVDTKLQAFNHRLVVTTDVANQQAAWPEPMNYNPLWYELHGRAMALNPASFQTIQDMFTSVQICTQVPAPGFNKFDWNNNGLSFSTDFIGGNAGYVTTDYAARQTIVENHYDYTLGLIKFLRTDPRTPAALLAAINSYKLTKDEFVNDDYLGDIGATYAARLVGTGMSPELYVRESVRMVGDYVATQSMFNKTTTVVDPVAYGNYPSDGHFCSRWDNGAGACRAEGGMSVGNNGGSSMAMFGIDYRVMLPKSRECSNLLVSCNGISVSHVFYNSIRMEFVFSSLGEAAGVAAALSVKDRRALHNLTGADIAPYVRRTKIIPANVVNLSGASAVATHPDCTITPVGTWTYGLKAVPDYLGVGYASDGATNKGNSSFKLESWNTTKYPAGRIRIRLNVITSASFVVATKVIIKCAAGTFTVYPLVKLGRPWFTDLGIYQWAGDGSDYIQIINAGDPAIPNSGSGTLLPDAVHLEPLS